MNSYPPFFLPFSSSSQFFSTIHLSFALFSGSFTFTLAINEKKKSLCTLSKNFFSRFCLFMFASPYVNIWDIKNLQNHSWFSFLISLLLATACLVMMKINFIHFLRLINVEEGFWMYFVCMQEGKHYHNVRKLIFVEEEKFNL